MPVVVIGTEGSFSALRTRLFGKRRVPAATVRRVEEAVRAANPHLDLDALRPGAVVSVPDLAEIDLPDGVSLDAPTLGASGVAHAEVKAGLDALVEAAGAHAVTEGAERKRVQRAFANREVRAAIERDPDLRAAAEAAQAGVEAGTARSRQQVAALTAARERWAAELDVLRELFG